MTCFDLVHRLLAGHALARHGARSCTLRDLAACRRRSARCRNCFAYVVSGMTTKSSCADVESARARALGHHADDLVLLEADADRLADRIQRREERLHRPSARGRPRSCGAAPRWREKPADSTASLHRRTATLGRADDRDRLGALAPVVHALLRRRQPPPPSVMSTISIDGASRSIASASAGVMFGRFISSLKFFARREAHGRELRDEHRVRADARGSDPGTTRSKPRMSDVMPTIDVMPMTMPSTVRADRSLLPRTVSHDIDRISLKRLQRIGYSRLSASIGSSAAPASPDTGRRTGRRRPSSRCPARPTRPRRWPAAG